MTKSSKNVAIVAYNKKIAEEIKAKLQFAPRPVQWSAEQAAFLAAIEGGIDSILLEAVAGAGKTTTLIAAARLVSDDIQAGTAHSFGFSAYRRAFGNVKIDARKVSTIVTEKIDQEIAWTADAVTKLVAFAKDRGIGFLGSIDDDSLWYDIATHYDVFETKEDKPFPDAAVIACAKEVLKASNKLTATIDFSDMIYLPLLLGMRFWQFDMIMVDEAQDTNPIRRALYRAMLKKGGRMVAVGDRAQAIYGFTGADNDSLDQIAKEFSCVYMPLTTTFRCPKAVVNFASKWATHIKAADTAPEGSVSSTTVEALLKANTKLDGDSAILCRNTAPVVSLAFRLIRNRIGCKVEGRDIGEGLKKLVQRWKVKTTDALLTKLETFEEREKTKALARKNEVKAQQIEDQCETIRVIIDNVNSDGKTAVSDVLAAIDSMFADDVSKTKLLTLSTIHKSKGREWKTVFWLDREATCPSKYARQTWQKDQERNIQYVAATRAMESLVDLKN